MFCGNIFTSTDLQNHKKIHMKKSPKRFHRVNRASFLSLSNEFEDQKLISKISPNKFWSAPCFPKIVCGGQCGGPGDLGVDVVPALEDLEEAVVARLHRRAAPRVHVDEDGVEELGGED